MVLVMFSEVFEKKEFESFQKECFWDSEIFKFSLLFEFMPILIVLSQKYLSGYVKRTWISCVEAKVQAGSYTAR